MKHARMLAVASLLSAASLLLILAGAPLAAQATDEAKGLEVALPGSIVPPEAGFQIPDVFPTCVQLPAEPLITHPGGGAGGADASRLQTTLGMTTYGVNAGKAGGYRVADGFVVPPSAGAWSVTGVLIGAYQTLSTTTSTIDEVNLRIWNGPPNSGSSVVVWGDTATNRLGLTGWINAYRDSESNPGNADRPIMAAYVPVGVVLPPGVYWLDYQIDGDAALTGPWAPPVTILGTLTTGDALQWNGTSWQAFNDSGSGTAQGLPFVVYGAVASLVAPAALVTSPGAGPGGADLSEAQDVTLGLTSRGFNVSLGAGFRGADDFVVPAASGGWVLTALDLFPYLGNATPADTIDQVNLRIWNGPPGEPGSVVVFGDTTTNRLYSSGFANLYRLKQSEPGDATRPVFRASALAGVGLVPGTYWLDFQVGADAAFTGPWMPPVTIVGRTTTGNARQWTGASWDPAVDATLGTPQGFPFVLRGWSVNGIFNDGFDVDPGCGWSRVVF